MILIKIIKVIPSFENIFTRFFYQQYMEGVLNKTFIRKKQVLQEAFQIVCQIIYIYIFQYR